VVILGFIFFRILDIFKPFPISWLDLKVSGGLGIVADDIAAGVISNIILRIGLYTIGG
jgi:phosphatidylglycerophosphatase A